MKVLRKCVANKILHFLNFVNFGDFLYFRGQYVVTVRANDADDGLNGVIRYFLAPPDSSPELGGAFDIDEATGVVTTATMLNRENVAHFELFVTAVDSSPINPRNATVSLTIQSNPSRC